MFLEHFKVRFILKDEIKPRQNEYEHQNYH